MSSITTQLPRASKASLQMGNASITIERARELGDRLGFKLRSANVGSGYQMLRWECVECGDQLERSYREMRNVRRCRACVGRQASSRLGIDHLP